MTTRLDRRVDGITVDNYEARFTGRIPLEDTEAQAAAIDEVLVMVVVAKVDSYTPKIDKSGDLTRTNVMKVTDARLIDGELRTVLVEKLGLYGEDTVGLPMKDPNQDELPFPADEVTGEITDNSADDDTAVPGTVEVVGRIGGGGPQGTARPGVVPFNPDSGPVAPANGQIVGTIHGHKDPALSGFLSEV